MKPLPMQILHDSPCIFLLALTPILLGAEACTQSAENSTGLAGYHLSPAFPNLSFERPVDLQHPGDQTNRLFVVEQAGRIYEFSNVGSVSDKRTFLDIRSKVDDGGNEEGLLGLAFHPDYGANGYFYVNYTAGGQTMISRFNVSATNADAADPSSELVILTYAQPYSNHNGGQVSFGPDGYLYIAVGDGGSGGDPQGNGQNRSTLLGTILRIDVDHPATDKEYGIPADNPLAGNSGGFREEIFAYGMRNPWRFSFDPETGELWAGDVGQNDYEEIDVIEKGGNYGWNIMEGRHCYALSGACDSSGLQGPVWDYGRSQGVCVTGGFVYRGPSLPELTGKYIYADYGSGRIWSLDNAGAPSPVNNELLRTSLDISSFGVDDQNELYLCAFDGKIYRLTR